MKKRETEAAINGVGVDLAELAWQWAVHQARHGDAAELTDRLLRGENVPKVARAFLVELLRSCERGAPLVRRRRGRLRGRDLMIIRSRVLDARAGRLARKDIALVVRELANAYCVTEATIRDVARAKRKRYRLPLSAMPIEHGVLVMDGIRASERPPKAAQKFKQRR
jgi:hypothetical protein